MSYIQVEETAVLARFGGREGGRGREGREGGRK